MNIETHGVAMDPLTQGLLGAAAAQTLAGRERLTLATVAGCAGGMSADLDVLIRSSSDPLLALEFHRQFTHALAFIPVGGLVTAAALWVLSRGRHPFRPLLGFATAGYATHALLDACTSYGTRLLWPFAETRFAWNLVAVVDPVVTLALLAGVWLTWRSRRRPPAAAAILFMLVYFGFGWTQRERGHALQQGIAGARGHRVERSEVKPSFANLLVWRSVYEAEGRFHVDALRFGPGLESYTWPGGALPKLETRSGLSPAPPGSTLLRDIERFAVLSDGYLAVHPSRPALVGDVRYAMAPQDLEPLWAIGIDPTRPDAHVPFVILRDGKARDRLPMLLKMIFRPSEVAGGGTPAGREQ